MKLAINHNEDIEIEADNLGVRFTISAKNLLSLARAAHSNRGKKAKKGPVSAEVSGKRPEAFQNRYIVAYEQVRPTGATGRGTIPGLTAEQAATRFEQEKANPNNTWVGLLGPKDPDDVSSVILQQHGSR